MANFFNSNRKIRPKRRNTSGTRPITWLFSTPTERLGPNAGTHLVHYPSHGFFLAGKLKTGPRPIHVPYFGVKTGSRPVHIQFWLFSSSRQLDDPIFHVYRTWIGFTGIQCWIHGRGKKLPQSRHVFYVGCSSRLF